MLRHPIICVYQCVGDAVTVKLPLFDLFATQYYLYLIIDCRQYLDRLLPGETMPSC